MITFIIIKLNYKNINNYIKEIQTVDLKIKKVNHYYKKIHNLNKKN